MPKTNVFDAQNRATTTDTDGQVTTRTYDRSGRNTQMVMRQGSKTFYYNYSYFGDGREKSIAASGDAHGNATSTYDANNVRIRINQGKGDGQSSEQVKEMVVDNDGHVLNLKHLDEFGRGRLGRLCQHRQGHRRRARRHRHHRYRTESRHRRPQRRPNPTDDHQLRHPLRPLNRVKLFKRVGSVLAL